MVFADKNPIFMFTYQGEVHLTCRVSPYEEDSTSAKLPPEPNCCNIKK